ncbi:hypothetical protein DL89DRAFT_316893 [Linderina pennispora]|uniref:Dolichyldiphosphatase n=1 Tax=Linderina pennispora TaxID=61395 RepID=A0A1Y1W7P3_9FUNG|nr:uncharacterized protein DL89DRAFT_316893 [Linderina pennispora]ORX69553.1 hypothetical protein DL89DRAFT_316893 [Linderina pennispora]
MDTSNLKSFSLTHFQYEDGDILGQFLALMSLIPIFFIVMEATIVLSRRELAGLVLFVGQLLNELFNFVLKELIREERPHSELGDGFGMPSSHAQFMGLVQLGALVLGILVAVSRVYLNYHTVRQVVAGVAVGLAAGAGWFGITEAAFFGSGLAEWVLDTRVCQWLMVRDSRSIPDIARREYELSQSSKQKSE